MSLSVTASEFVPKIKLESSLSVTVAEFVPRGVASWSIAHQREPVVNHLGKSCSNLHKGSKVLSSNQHHKTKHVVEVMPEVVTTTSDEKVYNSQEKGQLWSSIAKRPPIKQCSLTTSIQEHINVGKTVVRKNDRKQIIPLQKNMKGKETFWMANNVTRKKIIKNEFFNRDIPNSSIANISKTEKTPIKPKNKLTRSSTSFIFGYDTSNVARVQQTDVFRVSKVKHRLEKQTETTMSSAFLVPTSVSSAISYSAMLKKKSEDIVLPSTVHQSKTLQQTPLTAEQAAQKRLEKKQRKKLNQKERKKQNKATQPVVAKKAGTNIMLDLDDLLNKLDQVNSKSTTKQTRKSQKQRKVVSTGVVSVVSGLAKRNTLAGKKVPKNKCGGAHNLLDATAPVTKRGKERETPKRKRPTMLKKIIKQEREKKRLWRSLQENIKPTNEEANAGALNAETKAIEPVQLSVSKATPEINDAVDPSDNIETIVRPETRNLSELPAHILEKLHSRKFREYCDFAPCKEINDLTHALLVDLIKYQDRVYHENPAKFKQKRRYVIGLREVVKHMKVKKIKALVIAPNIERISSEGGIDDYLTTILKLSKEGCVPCIYAMNRHVLGRTMKKKAPASVVGIFNYDGAQDKFKQIMDLVSNAKSDYREKVQQTLHQYEMENSTNNIVRNSESALFHSQEQCHTLTELPLSARITRDMLRNFDDCRLPVNETSRFFNI